MGIAQELRVQHGEKRVNSSCKCQSEYSGCAAASVGSLWIKVFKGLVIIGLFRVLPAAGKLVEERGRGSILNIIGENKSFILARWW